MPPLPWYARVTPIYCQHIMVDQAVRTIYLYITHWADAQWRLTKGRHLSDPMFMLICHVNTMFTLARFPGVYWIEMNFKIKAFGHAYLVHHSILFHSRGRLFQQPYIASIGVTSQASEASYVHLCMYHRFWALYVVGLWNYCKSGTPFHSW